MTVSLDRIDQEQTQTSFPPESWSRLSHDINDHNHSILMAADLLIRYWDDLSSFLSDQLQDHQKTDEYLEIVETMSLVINGVRNASLSIDGIIRTLAPAPKTPSEPGGEPPPISPSTGFGCAGGQI